MTARRCATLCALLAVVGCSPPSEFACESDDACSVDGQPGTCQMSGYCSLVDGRCPSGQRYVEHAPDELSEACVELVAVAANHHRIDLAWDGHGAAAFDIEQNGAVIRPAVPATRFQIRGLDPSTEYVVRVRAAGAATEDAWSQPASATTSAAPTGSYPDHVLADEPRGYWQMEETAGTELKDSTGIVEPGQVFGADQDVAGKIGSGIGFDGVDDRAGLGPVHTADSDWGWTWELWADVVAVHEEGSQLLGCGNTPRWTINLGRGISVGFLLRSEDTFLGMEGLAELPNGWHHLVLTIAGSITDRPVSKFYLDGELVDEQEAEVPVHSPWSRGTQTGLGYDGDLILNQRDSVSGVEGTYDEAAAYDYVLGGAQVARHHAVGVGP